MPVIVTSTEEIQALINKGLDEAFQRYIQSIKDIGALPIEVIEKDTLLKRLNITEPTLIKWRKKGKIPFLQVGTAVRYNWYAVVKALENKKVNN